MQSTCSHSSSANSTSNTSIPASSIKWINTSATARTNIHNATCTSILTWTINESNILSNKHFRFHMSTIYSNDAAQTSTPTVPPSRIVIQPQQLSLPKTVNQRASHQPRKSESTPLITSTVASFNPMNGSCSAINDTGSNVRFNGVPLVVAPGRASSVPQSTSIQTTSTQTIPLFATTPIQITTTTHLNDNMNRCTFTIDSGAHLNNSIF